MVVKWSSATDSDGTEVRHYQVNADSVVTAKSDALEHAHRTWTGKGPIKVWNTSRAKNGMWRVTLERVAPKIKEVA